MNERLPSSGTNMAYLKDAKCFAISLSESIGYVDVGDPIGTRSSSTETDPLVATNRLKRSRRLHNGLWFTVIFLNLGCALVLAGQIIMAPIFSSIYSDGLGVIVPAVITGSAILGSIASSLALNKLGCKTTLIISSCIYTLALSGNFYPTWYTLIPTAILGGLCMAIFSMAARTYIGNIAHQYSSIFEQDKDRVYSRMFVIHVLGLKGVAIFGNLCSSLILGTERSTTPGSMIEVDPFNLLVMPNSSDFSISFTASKDVPHFCGADYCNQDLGSSFEMNRPTKSSESSAPNNMQFYGIILLCVVTSFIGILLLVFFVRDIKIMEDNSRKSTAALLLDSFIQLKDPKLLLLLPLAVSQQCGDTFWVADFNKAFITCSAGIQYVGYVAIWSGISGGISCFVFGWFNKTSIRGIPLLVATLAHFSILLVIFNWKPEKDNLVQMSAITAIWYLGSGIKLSLVPALFGVIFSDNMVVAYSNLNMWAFIGAMVMYSWSHFLCMAVKMYIMFGIVVTSYVGYVIVEIIIHYEKKNIAIATTDSQDSRVNSVKDYYFVKSTDKIQSGSS